MSTKIYFIQENAKNYIKIGYSSNIKKRFQTLQNNTPHKLKLLASTSGNINDENKIHDIFHHLKIRGEWFYAGLELLEFIGKIRQTKSIPELNEQTITHKTILLDNEISKINLKNIIQYNNKFCENNFLVYNKTTDTFQFISYSNDGNDIYNKQILLDSNDLPFEVQSLISRKSKKFHDLGVPCLGTLSI